MAGSAAFAGCEPSTVHGTTALDACAAWISCSDGWPEHAIGFCLESIAEERRISSVVPAIPAEIACIGGARGDCDAIRACVGLWITPSETCVERCEGDVIVSCVDGQEVRTDCARTAPGNTCVETALDPTTGGGTARGCRSTSCTETSCCEGESFVDCGGSPSSWCVVTPCSWEGTHCGLYEMWSATYRGCVGDGEPCIEGTCAGTIATACVHGRFATPVDCADMGMICEVRGCAPPPTTAWCMHGTLICEGDVLAYCNAGVTQRVDCVELGFGGCETITSAGSWTARCVPLPPER